MSKCPRPLVYVGLLMAVFLLVLANSGLTAAATENAALDSMEGGWNYTEVDTNSKIAATQPDTSVKLEGSGSLKITNLNGATTGDYGRFTFSYDMTGIEALWVWVRTGDQRTWLQIRATIDGTYVYTENFTTLTANAWVIRRIPVSGYTGVKLIGFEVYNRANSTDDTLAWFDNLWKEYTITPPKYLGKPALYLPENDRDNTYGDNVYFEWTIGENSENSRIEIFDNAGVCVENHTLTDNFFSITTLGADNYTWRVWAENKDLTTGGENVSVTRSFEVMGAYVPPTTTTTVDVTALMIFFLPWVLCILALKFDNQTMSGFGGITFIFAGIYFISSVWAGVVLVCLGLVFIYSVAKT